MQKNYYYIVASLPDLIFDSPKKAVSIIDFIEDISDLLTAEHASFLELFRLGYDNSNLVNVLDKRGKEFDVRGNFSKEKIEEEIKFPENLPCYMLQFVEAFREEKLPYPDLSVDDQLTWLFYEKLTAHKNVFLSTWFTFDLNLRNLLAGLNCRRLAEEHKDTSGDFALSKTIIGSNEFADFVRKSRTPDFSLSLDYPWVEKVLSLDRQNLVEFEKNIDTLRWDALDEMTTFTYFQIETILAFCIKLDIVERWQRLKPEVGEEKLKRLLSDLESSYTIMEEEKK